MTIVCSKYMVLLYKYYVVNLKLYCTSILNINYNTYVQDSQLRIESSNTDVPSIFRILGRSVDLSNNIDIGIRFYFNYDQIHYK